MYKIWAYSYFLLTICLPKYHLSTHFSTNSFFILGTSSRYLYSEGVLNLLCNEILDCTAKSMVCLKHIESKDLFLQIVNIMNEIKNNLLNTTLLHKH